MEIPANKHVDDSHAMLRAWRGPLPVSLITAWWCRYCHDARLQAGTRLRKRHCSRSRIGEELSQGRNPGSFTLEPSHTQYYHLTWKLIILKLKESKHISDVSSLLHLHIMDMVSAQLPWDVRMWLSRWAIDQVTTSHSHIAVPRKPPSFSVFPPLDSTNPPVYISHTNGTGS